jgi:hypothetical protein
MTLMVKTGSIISSMAYNRAKDGTAIKSKTTAGRTVQIISIVVP